MSTDHPFVMCKTPEGLRIIKLVDNDKVNLDRYHWTREQLESDYGFVSPNSPGMQQQFPYYELKA